MGKFRSISTQDFFSGFIAIESSKALEGIPRLRRILETKFVSPSVSYADGRVTVQLRGVDALGDKTLSDRVMDAFVEVFPELAAEPPRLHDDALGELTWEDECDGFEGQSALGENEVEFCCWRQPSRHLCLRFSAREMSS